MVNPKTMKLIVSIPFPQKETEMKTFKQIIEAMLKPKKTVDYEGHDYYGSPKKKVLTRKSPSSSGGDEE